ncbi:hypothetical protein [Actinomycetospora termitidis]|uniref:Uncharacterized protein n=1 Tax=Actinomycetospora termitidis TaxID=3053470 RepID=A0ABT7MDD5_9PSEU|nr:hypothetical protein [Actinomycetospora sp. Odt1-22]MDL5158677.1 hypothetical protein [Actinomycetospora sp. Odt1-22]
MSATVRTRRPARPSRPDRFPLPLPGWEGVTVTACLPSEAVDPLRGVRRGDVVRLALAIAAVEWRVAYVGRDRWRTDERGRLDARGTFRRPDGDPCCSPGALEVVGRNWSLSEGVDARPDTRLEVSGLLHVAATTPAAGDARDWVVRAWRRYRGHGDGVVGVPVRELPEAGDDDAHCLYLVDLADAGAHAEPGREPA